MQNSKQFKSAEFIEVGERIAYRLDLIRGYNPTFGRAYEIRVSTVKTVENIGQYVTRIIMVDGTIECLSDRSFEIVPPEPQEQMVRLDHLSRKVRGISID